MELLLILKALGVFIVAYTEKGIDQFFGTFSQSSSSFYPPYIFIFLFIALIPFYKYAKKKSLKDFFAYVFPKKLYTHESTKLDLKIFLLNKIFRPFEFIFIIFSIPALSFFIYKLLNGIYTPTWEPIKLGLFVSAVFGFVIADFAEFINHWLQHKYPLFWRVHRLHHSAEVLTPFAIFRNHPLAIIMGSLNQWVVFGISNGILLYLTADGVLVKDIMKYQFGMMIFAMTIKNFQHAHLWISFGPLSYIFVSPAMHQIHHSVEKEHHNKNFGTIFSIWDALFGTIYIPKEKLELTFGLSKKNPNPYKSSLRDAMFKSIK